MQTPNSPSDSLAASRDLLAMLTEIDALRSALAVSTPERQRLAFTVWIARARAAGAILRGKWADQKVGEVAEVLHRLSRIWWPGRVAALDPRSSPAGAWPGVSLESWRDVAAWCQARSASAESWADDIGRVPPPHDAEELFARACGVLEMFGGPLGHAVSLDRAPAVLAEARPQLPRLLRIAAELRWLRGVVPDDAWGQAIGRLRGLARSLRGDGEALAGVLAPALIPLKGWAVHLSRDPGREWVLGQLPGTECSDAVLVAWLARAFDVLDTPALAGLCNHLRARIAALQPGFEDRRHRRRFDRLRRRFDLDLGAATVAPQLDRPSQQAPIEGHQQDPRMVELRALLSGRRVLFVGNRSAPEIRSVLAEHFGLACDVVASAGSPRRRQALLQRIGRGAYDIVLVAHGFTGHADSEQLGEACRRAGILFCAVDKGRLGRIVEALWRSRHHPRLTRPVASRGSAA